LLSWRRFSFASFEPGRNLSNRPDFCPVSFCSRAAPLGKHGHLAKAWSFSKLRRGQTEIGMRHDLLCRADAVRCTKWRASHERAAAPARNSRRGVGAPLERDIQLDGEIEQALAALFELAR